MGVLPPHVVAQMSWHAKQKYEGRLRRYRAIQDEQSHELDLRVQEDHRWAWEQESIQDSWDKYIAKNQRAHQAYTHRIKALTLMAGGK